MLLALRERISGYIAWLIVFFISIPFMLWGIQEYVGAGQGGSAIVVNSNKVSMSEFDQVLAGNRQALLRSFGGRIPGYFDANAFLRQQTTEQLINRELLMDVIDDYNYRVSASALANTILQDPMFQTNNAFSSETYKAELSSRGLTERRYEELRLREMLFRQIQTGVQSTAFATDEELQAFAKLRYQTRSFDFIRLPLAAYSEGLTVSDEEVASYYEQHSDSLLTEQKISLEYIELSLADLASQVRVNEELSKQLYAEAIESGRYQTDEIRDASHILIRVPEQASEDELQEKRARLETILQRLQAGEDFAELAKAESDDPGSAAQGGSLGEVRRGAMVKPFEDALFAMQTEGSLSDIVKTRFGFHVIKLNTIKPSEVRPYAEIKDSLESEYQNKQAETAFYDQVDLLATISFENPDTLDAAAEAVGIDIKETALFTRMAGNGIANYPEVRTAAFEEAVLVDGRNSDLIEVAENHVVVIRLKENQVSRPKTLDEARASIIAELKSQKANTALAEAASKLTEELTSAKSDQLPALAGQYKGDYKSVLDGKRDSTEVPREAVQAVFRLPKPKSDDDVITDEIRLNNGDIAIARLNSVKDGDIAWLDNSEREQLLSGILGSRGRYDYASMLALMKAEADIVINSEIDPSAESETEPAL